MTLRPPKRSPLVPGYRLDRYELLCPIAHGGMAEVWVARLRGKHGFEKLVAIKTILPEYAEEPAFQRMFLDEAHIAAGIEHPNVAQILDLGEEHEVLYLVMEWVDGDALSKLQRAVVKKGTAIPIGIVLRVLADTCGGLHAAHELHARDGQNLGVVHRDVSPQNILVNNKGIAKLIDFGIAKARDRLGGETSSGMLKGKLQYMAPEQALGRTVDRRADVWAVGAILQHLLTGKTPFDAENQLATLHLLASGKPAPEMPSSVPASVAAVVRRALQHDPDKRIATAVELQAAIEGAMTDAWIGTSHADVAAFMNEHLADRAENRRKAVELALKAAAEREKMIELLQPPPSTDLQSATGLTLAERKVVRAAPRIELLPADASGDVPIEITEEPAEPTPSVPPVSERSATTTLGAAASSFSSEPPHRGSKRRIAVVALVMGTATSLLVIAAVVVAARSAADRHEVTPASTSRPEPRASEPSVSTTTATTIAPEVSSAEAPAATASPPPSASERRVSATPVFKPSAHMSATVKPLPSPTTTTKKKFDDGF